MNPDFQRLMIDATRLTREGDLAGATARIQSALAGRPAPRDGEGDVIDVEARELPPQPPADAAQASAQAEAPAAAHEALREAPQARPLPADAPQARPLPADAPQAQPGQAAAPPADETVPDPLGPGFHAGVFGTGASARSFKLYVPPNAGTRPLPLVVMLHGCTQDPDDFARGTAMNEEAQAQGFFVLYPAQSQKANPQRCWNWFKHSHQVRGRGEPAILAGMTQQVLARHRIDPARVYVAGLSAGGAMAAILGEAYPDLFAAIGVHSGLPAGAAKDLPSALQAMKAGPGRTAQPAVGPPVIVFHGDADTTVHPSNGEHLFGTRAGEAPIERGRTDAGRAWTRRVRVRPDGAVQAEFWQVHGAPHAWSGGRRAGSYTDPAGPDATREMLRFFFAHPR